MEPTKVFVADHQELAVAGIKQLLSREKQFEIIGQTSSKRMLEKSLQLYTPDILVLDYANLRDFNLNDCLNLSAAYPYLKVFIITADQHQKRIMQVLESGVLAFLTKDCSAHEILNAFHSIVKGQKFFCNKVLDVLMNHKVYKSNADESSDKLSEREEQIIRFIAKGMGTQQIAAELNLSPHTINAHRKNILKKLDATSPVEMIVKAMSMKIITID
ncbi:DNA-binding NarL/FixJ family response regulator [Catalinimonas alkaloidigena]|uniref:LuxR C-terminal-related transcriptional regulator n=1 Tax=Catalinimonas alkaloidigena TaxID=1075417 RepID=UPI00240715EE|nr:response regulator transcription factor [Catalinimonas alkaloidigena]MDF9798072.1 DNA-binding NarL/FixJ family response regulator [Catalinimonas alkaloidigena]